MSCRNQPVIGGTQTESKYMESRCWCPFLLLKIPNGVSRRKKHREREREKTSHEHTESFRLFLSDWLAHKGDLQVAEDCTRVLAFVMAFAEAAGYKSKAGVPN